MSGSSTPWCPLCKKWDYVRKLQNANTRGYQCTQCRYDWIDLTTPEKQIEQLQHEVAVFKLK